MLLAELLFPGSLLSPLDRHLQGTATVPQCQGRQASAGVSIEYLSVYVLRDKREVGGGVKRKVPMGNG